MGTDNIGRDLLSLVIYGTRASLAIGFCTALAALFVGGLVGITAGYCRGATEAVLMRLAEQGFASMSRYLPMRMRGSSAQ
jgi:peptide/nickel transport system permease protein